MRGNPFLGQAHSAAAAPLVSVVVASYNMARYLPHTVQAVLSQSISDLEVHVIDDGSTDGTAEAVAGFSSDPRFHYHFQPNAGQTAAKNAGLGFCRGRFIGFCDGDDIWPSNRLASQIPAFAGNPSVGVVYGPSELIDENDQPLRRPPGADLVPHSGDVTRQLFKDNFIPFGAALVRRECFETMGGFDERLKMGIDWDLWLRISTRYQFQFVPEVALLYRIWGGQMSTNWAGRYDHAFRIMNQFVREFPDALGKREVRNAYSTTYVGRARARSFYGKQHRLAFADCLKALTLQPTNGRAYKTLLRVLLTALGASAPRP